MGEPVMDPLSQLSLPPGFRFYPTDEELLFRYLCPKVAVRDFSSQIIGEINLYKFHPWDLPSKATMYGEKEWYFFTPRDRKYPNGSRPNRMAGSGYWKATGTDKVIGTEGRKVGIKKALVFYVGKAPKGTKTDWIMHEYRLSQPPNKNESPRLDDWVLCRIYKKNSSGQRPIISGVESREHSHGSPSSSSSQFNSCTETEGGFFNLPAMDPVKTSQQDEKINLRKLGSGNFDWGSLAGLISVPELASLRESPVTQYGGQVNSNNDQMDMSFHSIPRFGGDVNQETQGGLRPQFFNLEFFPQNHMTRLGFHVS